MIFSHTHRYLYVELSHTGTTALANELRQQYAGSDILRKHAHYGEFLRAASVDVKRYFVFSGIRNPLDEAVSVYFKYKADHRRRYNRMEACRAQRVGSPTRADGLATAPSTPRDLTLARTFAAPIAGLTTIEAASTTNASTTSSELQGGFSEALRCLGIEPQRPLPLVNRTNEKRDDFWSYFSPDLIPQAKRVLGPFMHAWGYAFPPEWGESAEPPRVWIEYRAVNMLWDFYWRYLRWHPSYGQLLKALR
jgi:hypothetical protein